MILSKHEIISAKAVAGILAGSQYQPAGVDLSLRAVFSLESAGAVDFDNSERKLSETKPIGFGSSGWLHLKKGAYKISYNEAVRIPSDCVGFGFPRSSLLRCGADIRCAVWDPGYEGKSESLLIVSNAKGIRLKEGARVLQLVFARISGSRGDTYSGRYHKENL